MQVIMSRKWNKIAQMMCSQEKFDFWITKCDSLTFTLRGAQTCKNCSGVCARPRLAKMGGHSNAKLSHANSSLSFEQVSKPADSNGLCTVSWNILSRVLCLVVELANADYKEVVPSQYIPGRRCRVVPYSTPPDIINSIFQKTKVNCTRRASLARGSHIFFSDTAHAVQVDVAITREHPSPRRKNLIEQPPKSFFSAKGTSAQPFYLSMANQFPSRIKWHLKSQSSSFQSSCSYPVSEWLLYRRLSKPLPLLPNRTLPKSNEFLD